MSSASEPPEPKAAKSGGGSGDGASESSFESRPEITRATGTRPGPQSPDTTLRATSNDAPDSAAARAAREALSRTLRRESLLARSPTSKPSPLSEREPGRTLSVSLPATRSSISPLNRASISGDTRDLRAARNSQATLPRTSVSPTLAGRKISHSATSSPVRRPSSVSTRSNEPGSTRGNPFEGVSRALGADRSIPPGNPRMPVATAPAYRSTFGEREVRVKGINFTTALEAIQRIYSPTARLRIEKESPGEVGDALRFGGIVVGGWYPVAWYRDFWKSLQSNLGIDEAGARRIGHRAAGIGVNVAYRALARMSSPAMLLSMSARAFGYYYEPATLIVKQPEPKRLTAEWRDCHGFDNLIWSELEGGATYFVEATGVQGVVFSVIAGGGTASHMLATATWR